jgi:hypothetical protein
METLHPLPDVIAVAQSAGGLRYRLPRRMTRRLVSQAIKMALLGAGLLAAGISLCVWAGSPLGFGLSVSGFLMLAGSPFVLTTRAAVEVSSARVILTEWFGPFPAQRIRPRGHLRQLVVHRLREGDGADPPPNGVIEVVCAGSQMLWFAAGYPTEWLTALAGRLGQHCQVPWAEDPEHDSAPVTVVPSFLNPIRDEDTFDQPVQPVNSGVVVEEKEDGLTVLRVPPDGRAGPLAAVPCVLAPLFIFAGVVLGGDVLPWPLPLVVPLVLVAPVFALFFWHGWSRWTVLAASEEGLGVLRTGGPFRPWERFWPRAQIAAVRTGPGSGGARGQNVYQVGVHFTDGKEFGLCCGRAQDELRWLATVLRQTLHVPPVARETVMKG